MKYGVTALPTLIVNSVVLHDGVSVNTVFAAICDGCATENIPSICQTCDVCPELEECIINGFCSSSKATARCDDAWKYLLLLNRKAWAWFMPW